MKTTPWGVVSRKNYSEIGASAALAVTVSSSFAKIFEPLLADMTEVTIMTMFHNHRGAPVDPGDKISTAKNTKLPKKPKPESKLA